MSRREVLRKAALAVSVGLAGCSVIQGGSDDVNSEYELTTEDYLARAVGELNTVALAIREFQASEDPGEAAFDDTGPRERLDAAREAIGTAEESATSDAEKADVQAVRAYAETMEGTVNAVQGLDDASTRLAEVRETLQAEEVDTEAASSTLGQATEASSSAVDAHERATSSLGAADEDRLTRLNAQYQAMDAGLERLSSFVTGVDALTVGYDRQVTGIDHLQTAEDRVTAEEYDAAAEAFSTAQSVFEESATAFSEAVEGTADALVSDLERGDKQSRSLAELAGGYVALLAGRDAVSTAQAELKEEAFDAARESLTTGSDEATRALDRFETGVAILENEFTDLFASEFETARTRARAIESLSTGYATLLDARDHITDAESRIERDEYDQARESLQSGGDEADTADQEFEAGQEQTGSVFATEFETARGRAAAVESLADGYVTLLDARDDLEDGESSFLDGAYEDARSSFDDAAETSRSASETFAEGANSEGADVFDDAFEPANQRTAAVEALGNGYATMVSGREDVQAGRDALENREFDSAADYFEAAGDTLDDAGTAFSDGQEAASGEFQTEFERALCQLGHLQSALEHYQAAAEAGSNRNQRKATEERNDGDDERDRVEDC